MAVVVVMVVVVVVVAVVAQRRWGYGARKITDKDKL